MLMGGIAAPLATPAAAYPPTDPLPAMFARWSAVCDAVNHGPCLDDNDPVLMELEDERTGLENLMANTAPITEAGALALVRFVHLETSSDLYWDRHGEMVSNVIGWLEGRL